MLKFQIDFPFRTNFRKIFQFHHFNVRRTFDFIQIQINSIDYHMLGNTQTKIKRTWRKNRRNHWKDDDVMNFRVPNVSVLRNEHENLRAKCKLTLYGIIHKSTQYIQKSFFFPKYFICVQLNEIGTVEYVLLELIKFVELLPCVV